MRIIDAQGNAVREGYELTHERELHLIVVRDEVRFGANFPTAGRYRLFLQFKAGGEVRTADYTLEIPR